MDHPTRPNNEHAYLLFALLSCTANKVCTARVAISRMLG